LLGSLISIARLFLIFIVPNAKPSIFVFSFLYCLDARERKKLVYLVARMVDIRSNDLVEIFDFGLPDFLRRSFNERLHKLSFTAVLSPHNQSIERLPNRRYPLNISWS
jgi:hypothetical protein